VEIDPEVKWGVRGTRVIIRDPYYCSRKRKKKKMGSSNTVRCVWCATALAQIFENPSSYFHLFLDFHRFQDVQSI